MIRSAACVLLTAPRTFLDMGELEAKLFGRTRNADEALGIFKKAVSAQASARQSKAQDGGVATALLVQALESGIIDCAVITDRDEEWRTVARVVTHPPMRLRPPQARNTPSPTASMPSRRQWRRATRRSDSWARPARFRQLRKVQLLDEPYDSRPEEDRARSWASSAWRTSTTMN